MTSKEELVGTKPCRYDCGKELGWDKESGRWLEVDTLQWHSYKRCGNLLADQGKKPVFDRPYDR